MILLILLAFLAIATVVFLHEEEWWEECSKEKAGYKCFHHKGECDKGK
jgi:hypothetical protein